jgi:hypothetical protein
MLSWSLFLLAMGAAVGAAFGFLYLSVRFGARYYHVGILLALYYFFTWLSSDGVRLHRGIFAVFTAAASLLPLTGLVAYSAAAAIVRGLLELECVLGGLSDHVLLVRSFREIAAGSHEHAVPRAC